MIEIEQYAQKLWEHRSYDFIERIEKECGYAKRELNAGSWGLEWEQLPDKARDHLREMAAKELEATSAPPSEVEQYLITLFRELERLRPAFGIMSHGILWDQTWRRLLLVINVGDAVYLQRLYPGDLTSDPIQTAASLEAKLKTEFHKPDSVTDANIVGFKR